jgi:Zn-finger nucleic acid-binding protein
LSKARVYRCAECGGPNHESARHCEFCRTPIATLRCAHCFAMSPSENEHCGACGETLGLLPAELPSTLSCPECKQALQAFDGNPGQLHDCNSCGGQFVEHDVLCNLIERRRRFVDGHPPGPVEPLARDVRYFPCPACAELMNRRTFGGSSGIIVDYCSLHGVWFHSGELPRLLAHVARGGLADGRRIRLGLPAPRTEAERSRTAQLVAKTISERPPAPEPAARGETATQVAFGVAQGALDLLEAVGSFILESD